LYTVQAEAADVTKSLQNKLFTAFSGWYTEMAPMLFKTAALDHSATHPKRSLYGIIDIPENITVTTKFTPKRGGKPEKPRRDFPCFQMPPIRPQRTAASS
jgi:hypothetical protein